MTSVGAAFFREVPGGIHAVRDERESVRSMKKKQGVNDERG